MRKDGLLLPEEVAERLRIPTQHVLFLIRSGELPAIVVPPDLIRIAESHLRRFLRARVTV